LKAVKANGFTLHIESDEWLPDSPRDTQDNLGKMYCWHRRYNIGDKNPYKRSRDFWDDTDLQSEIFTSVKVYLLDHSVLRLGAGPFACDPDGWDSDVLGIVYATKKNVQARYGNLSDETKAAVEEALRAEIAEYDDYMNTEYYRFWIEGLDGECVDSCGGFVCDDETEMLKAMKEYVGDEYYPLFDKALAQAVGSEM
jgi:hypothetical protein